MSKEKAPAFQFYAAEYLADENVQVMSIEDEGCYIRLLCYCWREGSIPADPEMQARLCKGIVPSRVVQACFKNGVQNGRLVHARLDKYREERERFLEKSALGGKRSAHKRKHYKDKTDEQGGASNVLRVLQPNVNSSSSSSSSSASSNIPPIVPHGTCEIGKKFNGHCENCQASFDAFWGAYPRHEPGRKQARKSWCKAWSVGMPPVAELLKWITEAEISKQWQDPSAIPHATTWLNQRRWEGQPPPPDQSAKPQADTSFLFEENYEQKR